MTRRRTISIAREIASVRADIEDRAATLRRILLAGRANLDSAANRVSALLANRDPDLSRLHDIRLSLRRVDLQHLGVDPRTLFALAATSAQLTMSATQPQSDTRNSSATGQHGRPISTISTLCLQSGGAMAIRIPGQSGVALRTHKICARYPACMGTLP